jgi:voltage-gated potassium channel Kch
MRLLKLYLSLFRAVAAATLAPKVRALLLFCLLISALQAVVFRLIEGWPLIDSFYFAVVTMATVGYGDFVPETVLGKLAAIAFMFIGIGVFVLTFSTLAQEFLRQATHGPDQSPTTGKETEEARQDPPDPKVLTR